MWCIDCLGNLQEDFFPDMTDCLLLDKNWTNFSVCVKSGPLLKGKQCQREPSGMTSWGQIQDCPAGAANPKELVTTYYLGKCS